MGGDQASDHECVWRKKHVVSKCGCSSKLRTQMKVEITKDKILNTTSTSRVTWLVVKGIVTEVDIKKEVAS